MFIDTNQFQDNPSFFFNGAQLYALGRAALESGATSVGFVHLNVGTVPTGDASLPFWGSLQPSTSLDPGRGTELLMTGGPEDNFQNNAPLDHRIAVWSLTGTGSLNGSSPSVALRHTVLTSETYGLPINTGATQKTGPTPLRDLLGDTDPLETINANDSRMNQVVDVGSVLYGGVNTTVTSATGPARVGVAYFAVGAIGTPGGVFAHILHQGYVAVDGENVLFPSIAVNRFGIGAMSFTLSGPDFFPGGGPPPTRQAKVLAQRAALVVGAEDAALLQQRHDRVGELVQAARGDVRDEDEAVAGVGLDEIVDRLRDGGRRADERLPAGDLDDQFTQRKLLGSCLRPPLRRSGHRVAVHAHAGPAPGDGVLAGVGIDVGQRAVRVVAGQVAVPQLLGELDRGLPADLLAADLAGDLLSLGVGVAEHEGGRRQDQQLVVGAAVPGQPPLDVGVEGLALLQCAVPAEDRVGAGRGELAALVGVAGLEDDRPALRAARAR